MPILDYAFMALAALAAGFVNAIAGGGTLITFPVLVALGLPPVAANVTNTVALLPGYLGGTIAQREDMRTQSRLLFLLLPVAAIGGLGGALLLIASGDRLFSAIVPWLILAASLLLALQPALRSLLVRRAGEAGRNSVHPAWSVVPLVFASVYGGYFGAGLSVIVLAALGLGSDESLTRLNALKQAFAFAVNLAAAIFFAFSGKALWTEVAVMATAALAGGWLGGRFAGRLEPTVLRWTVVGIGLVVAVVYLIKR
ncbi:MAG TPA: sulfite exporter TauE/SafE family protein [Rectinemataceae bacterium]|nr:sulfite exporter TauE/SafE family protein [Rectinemataceae bacterium]